MADGLALGPGFPRYAIDGGFEFGGGGGLDRASGEQADIVAMDGGEASEVPAGEAVELFDQFAGGARQRSERGAVGGGRAHFAGLGVAGEEQAQLALSHGLDDHHLAVGSVGVRFEGIGDGAGERTARIDRFGLIGRRRQADTGRHQAGTVRGAGGADGKRRGHAVAADQAEQRRHPMSTQPVGMGAALVLQRIPGGAGDGDGGGGGDAGRPGAMQPGGLADEQAFLARRKVRLARCRGDREHFQSEGHRDTYIA